MKVPFNMHTYNYASKFIIKTPDGRQVTNVRQFPFDVDKYMGNVLWNNQETFPMNFDETGLTACGAQLTMELAEPTVTALDYADNPIAKAINNK